MPSSTLPNAVALWAQAVATTGLAGLVWTVQPSDDDGAARRLVRTNWWRTAAWTAGAAGALVPAARGT